MDLNQCESFLSNDEWVSISLFTTHQLESTAREDQLDIHQLGRTKAG